MWIVRVISLYSISRGGGIFLKSLHGDLYILMHQIVKNILKNILLFPKTSLLTIYTLSEDFYHVKLIRSYMYHTILKIIFEKSRCRAYYFTQIFPIWLFIWKIFLAFMCVCLFVCMGLSRPTREFFTHMETTTGEGLHILTYARHSWPLSSEGS